MAERTLRMFTIVRIEGRVAARIREVLEDPDHAKGLNQPFPWGAWLRANRAVFSLKEEVCRHMEQEINR